MSSRMHAMERESIRVTRSVLLPVSEIELRVSRSSGPGGQHAQKSSTRVEALFDVESSSALTDAQKRRVVARGGRVLRAVAQDQRSQARNRELATERLVEKLRAALAVPRRRVATSPRAAARERRLEEKRRRGRTKALRRPRARNRLAGWTCSGSQRCFPSFRANGHGSSTTSAASREVGPITMELSDAVADHMNIRRGEVHEVVSFYSFLQVPTDARRVCTGPVCDCFGARELLASTPGAIEVACLGHCDLAPVMTLGDEIVPAVTHCDERRPGGRARARRRHARRLRGARWACAPARAADARADRRRAEGLGAHGLRRRRLPHRLEVGGRRTRAGPRYVVVNADEGEPGTIKDRYVMELRPHLMVEATVLAMRVLDAPDGYIYLREEYATARARLQRAIDEPRAAGLLDGLSLELVVGAGAYIAGEETAMLESMEGRRAMPRLKPPFPSQVGYLGRPTLIQNVETLAHIPAILRDGGEWWAALGTREAKGTRLWSVTGAVARPGCYEAPNGVTTRELVDEHAGGFVGEVGAIVPGGAASGILPPAALDAPLTRDGTQRVRRGAGLGRRPGLPSLVLARPPAGRDDAVLRRGVVPEVHALPHRQPRAASRRRGARARTRGDDAREGRRVAARDGEDVHLRARVEASPFPVRER